MNFSIDKRDVACYLICTRYVYILLGQEGESENMDLKKLQKRLVDARGDRSRAEVASTLGISLSALAMYENGARVPRDEIKERMAALYETSVGALFFDEKVHEV